MSNVNSAMWPFPEKHLTFYTKEQEDLASKMLKDMQQGGLRTCFQCQGTGLVARIGGTPLTCECSTVRLK